MLDQVRNMINNHFVNLSLRLCSSIVYKVLRIMKEMLTIAPPIAFISDSRGNYPLHIAIHNQQSYAIICEIFKSSLGVMNIQDTRSQLIPYMLAAVGDWKSEKDQLSIIYFLLREDPHSIFGH